MEPEGEWTFEGGPKIIVGADGDPARYHRSAYDGMRQVGEPERILRYQNRRMPVRTKRVYEDAPSRVAPQEL